MKKLLIAVGVAVLMAGCSSTKEPDKVTKVEDRTPTTVNTGNTDRTPVTQPTGDTGKIVGKSIAPVKDPANPLSKRVIYFDYDKDAVKSEFASLVQAHATFLSQNRNRKIRLEGHADERGSREYNMALGQRRADAVRKATAVLGVANDRMETISFGEDKPRSNGHDESAWSQNRHVEIVYDGE